MWIEDLGVFSGQQIAWALEQVRMNTGGEYAFPPNLPAFRRLCSQAPRPEVKALPPPAITLEQVQKRKGDLEGIKKPAGYDYKAWAKKIVANPKDYPDVSLKFAKEALGMESEQGVAA